VIRHRPASSSVALSLLVEYMNNYLGIDRHPDYPNALNGLQVDRKPPPNREAGPEVSRVAATVDLSTATIEKAQACGADLLVVHHGLFWGGLRNISGAYGARVRALIEADMALYSCHLPLDSHPEVGNCVLLARALSLNLKGRFGGYQNCEIGWWGELPRPMNLDDLTEQIEEAVGGRVRSVAGGTRPPFLVGVITGSGASFLEEASALGLDALVTGEANHHAAVDARELGIDLVLAGHYRTEVFGVRALAKHLEVEFGLPWDFIDEPTGF